MAILLLATTVFLRAAPGGVDSSFDPGDGVAGGIWGMAVQLDGKVLLGGSFASVGGTTRSHVARLDADGTLDTDFAPNPHLDVNGVTVQLDGRILLGGRLLGAGAEPGRVVRLNPDGTADGGFAPNVNDVVGCMAVQSDGDILLGGWFTSVGAASHRYIARVRPDGSVDSGFAPHPNGLVVCVAVQADGRVLIGGYFRGVDGTVRNYVARLNSDGALDPGFDANANDIVTNIAVQADGKILIAGTFTSVGYTPCNYIARLNTDGTVDRGFDPKPNAGVSSLALQTDGKILISGGFSTLGGATCYGVARLNADGSPDRSFVPHPNGGVSNLILQADGKVLLGGAFTSVGGKIRNGVARLTNDAAVQSLAVTSVTRVEWQRGGTAPEVAQVAFELSTDRGATWAALGAGTRIPGGWELTGLALPASGMVRAHGRTTGGYTNGSSSVVEQVQAFAALPASVPVVIDPTSTGITTTAAKLGGNVIFDGDSVVVERGVVYALTAENAHPRIGGTGVTKLAVTGAAGNFTADLAGLEQASGYSFAAYATNAVGTAYTDVATFATVPAETNANLSALSISEGVLSPAFARATTTYSASVKMATRSLTVTPTPADPRASVAVNGITLGAGESSSQVALAEGLNPIEVVVWSRDGAVRQTYTIAVTRRAVAGEVDTDFSPRVNGRVSAVAVQANGEILLGGGFTGVGSATRHYVARVKADGTLDVGFDPAANNGVYSLAVQPDGKVLIGGYFTSVGGIARNRVARVDPDGTLDAGFDPNADRDVYSLALQADGKILIGGQFTSMDGSPAHRYLARVSPDGTLDGGFDPRVNNLVSSVVVQTDGKILLGGDFTSARDRPRQHLARLHVDGTLDEDFDPNANGGVTCVVVQADGKIVFSGFFTSVGGVARNHIARVNADGTLDTGFDPNLDNFAQTVALQADGKIILGGPFTRVAGSQRNRVARLNADGTLDAAFDPNADGSVMAVALQADGRILLGGAFASVEAATGHSAFVRLVNDEAVEALAVADRTHLVWSRGGAAPEVSTATFELSTDGGMTWAALGGGRRISGGWEIAGLALSASGSVRVRGRTVGGSSNGSLGTIEAVQEFKQLPPSPTPVVATPTCERLGTTFATLGGAVTSNSGSAITERGIVYAVTAVDYTPRIGDTGARKVAVGGTMGAFTVGVTDLAPGLSYSFAAYATNASGTTYTRTSTFTTPPESAAANLRALALSAGMLSPAFAGTTREYTASVTNATSSVRVTAAVVDSRATVTVNGVATTPWVASGPINLAVGPNTITVVLTPGDGSATQTYTIALTRSAFGPGEVDPGFAPDINGAVSAMAVQPDGKTLLGGKFTRVNSATRRHMARLNADGALDPGFNPDANDGVASVAVQGDGDILLGGWFTSVGGTPRNNIARVRASGALDNQFDPNANGEVDCVAVQTDGKILFAGRFTSVSGIRRNRIARVNADGTLDPGFDPDVNGNIYSVAVQANGKIVLGGSFTTVGGATRSQIARINADGTLDRGFNPGARGSVFGLAVQADGKILLGGSFTSVEGTPRNNIARVNADGRLDSRFDPDANAYVRCIAVQADGKILFGGSFASVGGAPHGTLVRVNADGLVDPEFNPVPNSVVDEIAVRADGKILLAGLFSSVGGVARFSLAQVTNDAVTQTLSAAGASRVIWKRAGVAPEITGAVFELSTDGGVTWTSLGRGVRISGGWELAAVALPAGGLLRARGWTVGGDSNGSSGIIEQERAFPAEEAPVIIARTSVAITASAAVLGGEVVSDGNSAISERGVVYAMTAINAEPQIGGLGVTKVPVEGTTGAFSAAVTSLGSGTDYSYAAYATNALGTAYTGVGRFMTEADGVVETLGGSASFVTAVGSDGRAFTYRWSRNGTILPDADGAALVIDDVQPSDAGLYSVEVSEAGVASASSAAVLGVSIAGKVAGQADVVGDDIVHPNGNIFDQVLLTGAAETIAADAGQVTRTSFIDLDDDIVQVEFSGAGSLSLVLEGASGPAAPLNYSQPTVGYMKGHVGIVIAGADQTTNVSVFSVGRATAFDPTGHYDITKAIGTTNDPVANGNPIFAGHEGTPYDGIADLAFIAILSTDGKFGGVRTANANYFAHRGLTGVYAPGVEFTGPIYIGNISAFDEATPVIRVGQASDARIAGGDLYQDNGAAVQVSGLTRLKFTAGSDSQGNLIESKANQAVLQQDGVDVTSRIVLGP